MRLIEDLSFFPPDIKTVVTSGTFDGVHLGHQKILGQVVELARDEDLHSVVLTFWPHPRFILHQDDASLKLLSTFAEKTELIGQTGIDYLVRIPFTKEFSQIERDHFVQKILLDHLNTATLVIGYDHHFGKNRSGNFRYLEDTCESFGFDLEEIPRHDIDHVGVSSTKIRDSLNEGDVKHARSLLGRHYGLKGLVVHGDKKGRSIGFPTANIWIPEGFKLIPAIGSYATYIRWNDKIYEGMTNIGIRPTVNGSKLRIEVNIFNFDERIYGEEIEILFVDRLRDEMKFENIDALKSQLEIDKEITQKLFRNEKA